MMTEVGKSLISLHGDSRIKIFERFDDNRYLQKKKTNRRKRYKRLKKKAGLMHICNIYIYIHFIYVIQPFLRHLLALKGVRLLAYMLLTNALQAPVSIYACER